MINVDPPPGFTNMGLFHAFNKDLAKSRDGIAIPSIHIRPKERKIEFSTADN